ncbi:MAG: restriction endonuclease subunit S [Aeriscardovia sp.]|nr:restriction endonuclease subunit S [Aeriscardovia sp.]
MFPREGESVPRLRFPGFTTTWKQQKVSDISDRYDNLRIPVAANLRMKGSTPYYGANGIQDYVDGYTHDGEFILVAEDGANDLKNYPINYVNGRIWVNNHAHVIQAKEFLADNRFLSYAMGRADIESVVVGGGRAKLNAEALMNISLHIPSLSEQKQIGSLFHTLDDCIYLHEQ